MKKHINKILVLILGILAVAELGYAFQNKSDAPTSRSNQEIQLAYVAWDSEIASTHVIGQVLEDLGYKVTLTQLDNAIMWEAVATGEADAMVSAWLPGTHAAQYERYGSDLVDLGVNLEGAAIGLVVPSYMSVTSIEDLTQEANQVVTGIEPGAGVVAATEEALATYPNLSTWQLETSSSGAMTTLLQDAYAKQEEVIVTGWSPHWKFQTMDLHYLEDPLNVFGAAESIHTLVRTGLEQDLPEAYQVLDNFYWSVDDLEQVMLDISQGMSPAEAARQWVDANADKVATWTSDIEGL